MAVREEGKIEKKQHTARAEHGGRKAGERHVEKRDGNQEGKRNAAFDGKIRKERCDTADEDRKVQTADREEMLDAEGRKTVFDRGGNIAFIGKKKRLCHAGSFFAQVTVKRFGNRRADSRKIDGGRFDILGDDFSIMSFALQKLSASSGRV